jgi:hypothetical protein
MRSGGNFGGSGGSKTKPSQRGEHRALDPGVGSVLVIVFAKQERQQILARRSNSGVASAGGPPIKNNQL